MVIIARCVGDSRAYLLRENHLVQLTKDHSEVQRMVDMGVLTEEQMETHLRKNVITRYLGIPETEGCTGYYFVSTTS